MSVQPAVLMLDPAQRAQQLAAIAERVPDYRDFGDRVWVRIDEDQAARFAAQGISVQLFPDAELVVLPAVVFSPPDENPQPPDGLAAAPPAGDGTAYAVVLFAGTPQREWVNAVRDLGAALVEDLAGQAAVFRMSAAVADAVGRQPFVAWWGWYHPGYAIAYELCGRDEPYGAADFRTLAIDPAQLADGRVTVWFFDDADLAGAQTAVAAAGARIVSDLGDHLIVEADAAHAVALARVPGVRSVEPARATNVTNMRAGVITGVNQVRERGPVSVTLPVELDGAGEIAGVYDSGLGSGTLGAVHLDYNARVILIANTWDPAQTPPPPGPPPAPGVTCRDFTTHGSHVVGTIAGNASQAVGFAPALIAAPPNGAPPFTPPASLPRGVAPAAQIVFHSGNRHLPPPAAPGPNGPYVTETDVDFTGFLRAFRTAHAWGARVHSNSWEYTGGHNAYTGNSRSVDTFAWFNPEDVVVFATGNNEGDRNLDGVLDANSLGDTAVAKNIIAVGASENVTRIDGVSITYRAWYPGRYTNAAFLAMAGNPPVAVDFGTSDNANQVALFSNRGRVRGPGPAANRRIRPDIVAPGTNILSTAPPWPWPGHELAPGFAAPPAVPNQPRWDLVVNSAPQQFYYVVSGTSMAAPHVAGACLLTRQFYRVCYGQLRRPVRVSTETALLDRPAIAAHRDGCVVAWVRAGATNDVRAVRLSATTLAPVGVDVVLQPNTGAAPAIALARQGDNTVLLHRGGDNALRLSLYDPQLAAVAAFGVVTLAPLSRPEPDRRPAVCARDGEIAVVWVQTGTDNLLFQRYRAADGHAIDAAPVALGSATSTSAAPYVLHDGTRYAVVWGVLGGGSYGVLLRFVGNDGAAAGPPHAVAGQPAPLATPHLAWDARTSRYLVAWVSDHRQAAGDIMTRLVDATGAPVAPAVSAVAAAAGQTLRAPSLATHPSAGFVLTWEDNSRGTFDAFCALLGNDGRPDARIVNDRLLLSDIPGNTQGFSSLVTADAIVPVWHGTDSVNPPLVLGVDALSLTAAGAFRTVRDPNAPLLDSGRWVPHVLLDHTDVDRTAVAATWGGGGWFLLRTRATSAFFTAAELVRTNADGSPDATFGGGARAIDSNLGFDQIALRFTGDNLIAVTMLGPFANVSLCDADGNAVAAFGTAGRADLRDSVHKDVYPALSHRGAGATFAVLVAYGQWDAGGAIPTIKVLDRHGAVTQTVRDPANRAAGTARHGWFHLVPTDAPVRFIAVWHATAGPNTVLRLQRFTLGPTAPANVHVGVLNSPAGDAQNAVIAPRPAAFDPNATPAPAGGFVAAFARRMYGLAFQQRAAAANPWQVMFTHLTRTGDADPAVAQNVVVAASPNHQTDPQLIWHTDGYGLAWREQPAAGGAHRLMFACIDPRGVPLAAPYAVSAAAADVAAFQLAWNGRRFHLTWTETQAGHLRHVQCAVTALHDRAAAGYDRPFTHPTAALVRATLVNGATNINATPLPNLGNNPNHGYGWGRLNLRQSLAPAPPATFAARDDGAVANRRTARYTFTLPAGTRLLRVTLAWTDPPPSGVQNNLNLRVTTPAAGANPSRIYIGNHWQAANPRFSDPVAVASPANPFDGAHTIEQVVIGGNPTLPSGNYLVEVLCNAMNGTLSQFPSQPFAVVFAGSGDEWNLAPQPSAAQVPFY